MLDIPTQPNMVECPICNCTLKHDPDSESSPEYTVTRSLASHFCGDKTDVQCAIIVLIVSPLWSFMNERICVDAAAGESMDPCTRWCTLELEVVRGLQFYSNDNRGIASSISDTLGCQSGHSVDPSSA